MKIQGTEQVVNQIMLSLKSSKTAWRTGFKTEQEVNYYKQELLKSCIENGIKTAEQVEKGLAKARKDASDFFPSVGKFISWCLEETEHFEHSRIKRATKEFEEQRALPKPMNREVGLRHLAALKQQLAR